jgi:N-acyl-D-amino-acid deacylase
MGEYDLIIRGGTVIDGSGRPGYQADVAVRGGVIAELGQVAGQGTTEIDATGLLVTPGFVDVHTHYDGQVTWENRMQPSSAHGATTVITGNCGVGFAPCRPDDQHKLVKVMEGVEDIPEIVMTEGLPWNWQTFPDYLDALAQRHFDVDVGVQIPHTPIRVYVMGDRAVRREESNADDRRRMRDLVTEGIRAGAIGVSTSRSLTHRAKDGTLAPTVQAADEEVYALAEGLRAAGAGVFQLVPEGTAPAADEMAVIRRIAEVGACPVSFTVIQFHDRPDSWRETLEQVSAANATGMRLRPQVLGRPVSALFGLDLSFNPLSNLPGYRAIAGLPLEQRVAILRDPDVKARLLAEEPVIDPVPLRNRLIREAPNMFLLEHKPDYGPGRDKSVGALAARAGVTAMSMAYDLMLTDDGHAVLYLPSANYVDGTLDVARQMLGHPDAVPALGDGGAHYGVICDASYSTHLLTYWTRDAPEDQRFPVEWAVHALTRKAADLAGLTDRGQLAAGLKADLNVIDYEDLALYAPRPVYDLPSGGRRLRQRANGYVATVVSGIVTQSNGEPTGALPGRLVRGPGAALNPAGVPG